MLNHDDSVLSQEEVSSLTRTSDIEEERKESGIYTLLNSPKVIYERLPMLEIVFDRLTKYLNTALRNFTSDNAKASLKSMKAIRFDDFINNVSKTTLLGIFRAKEWQNNPFIITLDQNIIYAVLEALLGGRKTEKKIEVSTRSYSNIERNLILRLIKLILREFSQAFSPVTKVRLEFDHLENPRFARITQSVSVAIIVNMQLTIDKRAGVVSFLLPYSSLEPVRSVLLQMFMGEKFGNDDVWERHLANEVWCMTTTLKGLLGKTKTSLNEVLNWKKGSQLMLPRHKDDLVQIFCSETLVGQGKMGTRNGQIAILIDKLYFPSKKKERSV